MSNRLDESQEVPLSISRQRVLLALLVPADLHKFPIRPPPSIVDRKCRLTDDRHRGHMSHEAVDVGGKFDSIREDDRQRSITTQPKFLFKQLKSEAEVLILRNAIPLTSKLLLKVRQGLKGGAEHDKPSNHRTHQLDQTRARLAGQKRNFHR